MCSRILSFLVMVLSLGLFGVPLQEDFIPHVDEQQAPPPVTYKFLAQGAPRIHDIQGAGHISPLYDLENPSNRAVRDVPGVITGIRDTGFYMQDPEPDASDATSEGIFVFTGNNNVGNILDGRVVGDSVLVTGTVTEFRPGFNGDGDGVADPGVDGNPGLSVTEISSVNDIQRLEVNDWDCTACTIPYTVVGPNGRSLPNVNIDQEAEDTNIELSATFDEISAGIDFYESLEHMLVILQPPLALVSPSGEFGSGDEFWVVNFDVSDDLPNSRGGITLTDLEDFQPERIRITSKDERNSIPPNTDFPDVNVGAVLTSAVTGIVDYSFENYEVIATQDLAEEDFDRSQEAEKEVTEFAASEDQLLIGTYNVENLNPNEDVEARAEQIVNNLNSPDILLIQEIQDDNGTSPGVTAADETFIELIIGIENAGGPTDYDYIQIDPQEDQDGGVPGGNIRVGFLYRTSRVGFTPTGEADFDDDNAVDSATCDLTLNPGRVDPTNSAWISSRKPLAAQFTFQDESFYIISIHFNSKGGDNALYGVTQPPNFDSEIQRTAQAAALSSFVQAILDCDPNANVIIGGDFNDYQFSAPVQALTDTTPSLTPMNTTISEVEDRYSYVFNGISQTLDQFFASQNVVEAWSAQYDTVHINAEFFDQVSDHDPSLLLLSRANE
jgi:uncharacterized protein